MTLAATSETCSCAAPVHVAVGYARRCSACSRWVTATGPMPPRDDARPVSPHGVLTDELLADLARPPSARLGDRAFDNATAREYRVGALRRQVAALEAEIQALLERPPGGRPS